MLGAHALQMQPNARAHPKLPFVTVAISLPITVLVSRVYQITFSAPLGREVVTALHAIHKLSRVPMPRQLIVVCRATSCQNLENVSLVRAIDSSPWMATGHVHPPRAMRMLLAVPRALRHLCVHQIIKSTP